jgi:hypothetical protein
MKNLTKKIKKLKSDYAGLELRIARAERKVKKLMAAGLVAGLMLGGCSCNKPSQEYLEMRASYCESVQWEDDDNCLYVPANPNETIYYLPETDECRFVYADTEEEEVKNCFEEDLR